MFVDNADGLDLVGHGIGIRGYEVNPSGAKTQEFLEKVKGCISVRKFCELHKISNITMKKAIEKNEVEILALGPF